MTRFRLSTILSTILWVCLFVLGIPLGWNVIQGQDSQQGTVYLPVIAVPNASIAIATPTNTPRPTSAIPTASSTATVTSVAIYTPTPMPAGTATATPQGTGTTVPTGNRNIAVGGGYTDVSPKALVRTADNRLYAGVSTCDNYPCALTTQMLHMYRADSTGVPTGFTRKDSTHEPGGIAQWAVAIDGSDVIHVVFNTRSTDGGNVNALKYVTFNTATDLWGNVEIIDNGISFGEDAAGQGMQSVALALDANGKPHIVYLAGAARRVTYRNRIAGSWSAASLLDSGVAYSGNEKAWHPNLAFDPNGGILVVWLRGTFNGANDGTLYSRMRATDGTWGSPVNLSQTNAARTTIDQSTSILITPNGRYHVAWITQPDDYIRYSYSDDRGSTWITNSPGSGKTVSHNPSLGDDGAGRIRIYAHGTPSPSPDGHGDNLYYFSGAGGSGLWSSFTFYVTGTYDSSVNTRWSQFFYHYPSMLDIAYWNDSYPNVLYIGSEVATK